jgi:HEAT repeat protein
VDGVRAYCKQCKGNCDRAIYHQRQVRVLATLRSADSRSLYQAMSGQEHQPQGGKGYVYDDGAWLAYVLSLSDFTDEAHSLPQTHALWEAQTIWLDVSASNPKELALEVGDIADRLVVQAKLTEEQRQEMTVYVHQSEADPVVKPVLETRFGKVGYGVTPPAFLCGRAQIKVAALGEIGQNSTIPALRAGLNNDNWEQSAERLVKIGKPAVPALIAALNDGYHWRRVQAAQALGEIGDPSVVPVLVTLLQRDRFRDVQEAAAAALGKIGDPSAVPELIEVLKQSYDELTCVLYALVQIGKPAVPALIAAIGEGELRERGRVPKVLGEIGDTSAIPALIEALRDTWMCSEAVGALVKIGKPAVPALMNVLEDNSLNQHVVRVLIKIGEAETLISLGEMVVSSLIAALKDPTLYAARIDENVQSQVAETLTKIGTPAVPALIAALKDTHGAILSSYEILYGRLMSTEKSISPLDLNRLKIVCGQTAEILGVIGDNSAVPALIEVLEHHDYELRKQAIEALARIGELATAAPALIEAAKRHDFQYKRFRDEKYLKLRHQAEEALARIGENWQ